MAGIPKGVRNNNPGNLRFNENQVGAVKTVDNFARFETYDQGVRELDRQLNLYYTGRSEAANNVPLRTIREILSVYAPASENPTNSYVATVAERMGLNPDEVIPIDRLPNFRNEIIRVELGSYNGRQLDIDSGRELALAYNGGNDREPQSREDSLNTNAEQPAAAPIPKSSADAANRVRGLRAGRGAADANTTNSSNQIYPTFKDNSLSYLDNPSYYIRFFIINERDERTIPVSDPIFASLSNIPKVVLAETAVTGINIESLELKTAVGPNQSTKLVQALEFKMRIFEPMGLTFYDKLLAAARDLGIINFQKAPYYIEIKFHGYNFDGSYADNVGPDGPNTKRWLYKVFITDIQSEFTKAGTVYDISLVQSNDLGTGDNYFTLDSNYSMEGSTVKEVIDNLLLHKANSEIAQYGIQRNKYNIKILPYNTSLGDINIGSLQINPNPEEWAIINPSNTTSDDAAATGVEGQGSATFAKGNTIANIIEQIFASTIEGHKSVIRSNQPGIYGNETQFIIIPWILTSVKIREEHPIYDVLVQDYNREITYYVVPYLTTLATASLDQQIPLRDRQREKMIENLKIRVATGRLEKKYDYLFTGENTEVLNVDFKFDTFFKAVIPLYSGTTNNSAYRAGAQIGDQSRVIQAIDVAKQRIDEARRIRQQLEPVVGNNDVDVGLRQAIRARITEATRVEQEELGRIRDLQRDASVAVLDLANRNRIINITGDTFAEDLPSFSGNMYAVTIDKSVKESGQDGAGNIEANAINQSMTTAILNQTKDRAMVSINLEIRGDPYWLGVTNLEESFFQISSKKPNLAEYNNGNMYFILKALVPQGIEEYNPENNNTATAGDTKLSVNEAFTGLYLITFVHHKFNKGSFTQILEARRDVNIDINLIGGLNG